VLGLTRHDLDVTDRDAVRARCQPARPDVVVNLAAYTAVDRAETEDATCFAVNAVATESLSLAAQDVGAHLITISTDYVFDGDKGEGYVEDDDQSAQRLRRLQAGRRAACSDADTIVRTSWVMGVRGKNVAHVIAERALSGDTVRFVSNDQTGTVTVASDLARALVTLVRERPGGWHVANTGTTTWFDIAQFVGESLGRDDEFATAISTSRTRSGTAGDEADRSDLNTEKWIAAEWMALPDWRDGITRLIRDRGERGAAVSDVATRRRLRGR
jgi:dTDP-4-dehydrorhamnose reductase